MGLADIRREHVLQAVAEFDRLGRQSFLHQYGFGPARSYLLRESGRDYDSKAIVGVAHGYARPDLGPLDSTTLFGGVSGAAGLLGRLGFKVDGIGPPTPPRASRAVEPVWYAAPGGEIARRPALAVSYLVAALTDPTQVMGCAGFPWGRQDLDSPGLYSWWVDEPGAHELTAGLGQRIAPGVVYSGQAGADSARSGKASDATLRSRIGRNHLAGSIEASTWRRTLQAVLVAATPAQLTAWMHAHLALIAVPVPDTGTLLTAERAVLEQLDPPLNLMGMPDSPIRRALRALRREL